jgi:hypothetical protein
MDIRDLARWLPQFMLLGELWHGAVEGRGDAGTEDVATLFARKFAETIEVIKAVGTSTAIRDNHPAADVVRKAASSRRLL